MYIGVSSAPFQTLLQHSYLVRNTKHMDQALELKKETNLENISIIFILANQQLVTT